MSPGDRSHRPSRRVSDARRLAAIATGVVGTLAAGVGGGIFALALERRYPPSWRVGGLAAALVGLALVVVATRLARLSGRRALIASLGALLVVPPLARMVRDNAAGATSYAPAKRTATELRNLGLALEARAIDAGGYPPRASLDELAPLLEGTYMQAVPRVDGWGRPLRYEASWSGAEQRYFVASSGADGIWRHARLADYAAAVQPDGDDVVYSNGGFVTSPQR